MIDLEYYYFQSLMQTLKKKKSDIMWHLTEIHITTYQVFLQKKIKPESNQPLDLTSTVQEIQGTEKHAYYMTAQKATSKIQTVRNSMGLQSI